MRCKQRQVSTSVIWACSCLVLLFIGVAVSPEPVWGLETAQIRDEAEHGDKDAAYLLGVMYRTGTGGVSSDCQKALKWTEQAALQGHTLAQSHLGVLYSDGCGERVAKDPFKAYIWTALAARQGLRFAGNNLEGLEQQLHPYLVADAQQKVEHFKPATVN